MIADTAELPAAKERKKMSPRTKLITAVTALIVAVTGAITAVTANASPEAKPEVVRKDVHDLALEQTETKTELKALGESVDELKDEVDKRFDRLDKKLDQFLGL